VLNTLLFENFLDAQHLLDLVTDGDFALELDVEVITQLHAAKVAVLDNAGLVLLAPLAVGLQGHQAFTGNFSGQLHDCVLSRRVQHRPRPVQ
jgi:hypothetical protein